VSPRGRRPGGEDTRAAIVEAARGEFAARGYAGTSLRGIARAAEVDPRLVHHYFEGGKSALFAAVMAIPIDPATIIAGVVLGPPEGIGVRVVRTFLTVWDNPEVQPALVGLVRSALADEVLVSQLRDYVYRDLVGQIVAAHPHARTLSAAEQSLRAGLIATQMLGLVVGRYVVELPALAKAPVDTLVERIGPIIQAHLDR
jgi:AcrR family transcriptional regulator